MSITPPSLQPGDTIAIISPATIVKEEYIDGAVACLHKIGYNPVVLQYAKGPADGSYASSFANRLQDLKNALHNPEFKAIFCARGGYGCTHLLPHFSFSEISKNPKWLVGFSDISALHALWLNAGVKSIHGPMAKHLANTGTENPFSAALFRMLGNGGNFDIAVPSNPFNRQGEAEGVLRGGNLAVLNSLAATPYDILDVREGEEVILFIEDISEAIYAVERMLTRLLLSGTLHKLKGLIFGHFTEYKPDRNFETMEEMASSFLEKCGIRNLPVAFAFPTGHIDNNYPLTEGALVRMEVHKDFTRLQTLC